MVADIRPVHVFSLLTLFVLIWAVSEVREYLALRAFEAEMLEFKSRGERFTAEDGQRLEARIQALEDARE